MKHLVRWSTLTLLAAPVLAGCGGADEPAGNPLAADSAFEPRTDTVAGRLSKEQVDEIVRTCRRNAGIPGGDGDCTSSLPQSLPPCRPRDRWCLTGSVTGGGNGVIRIVDQGGDQPVCDPRLCTPIEVPDTVVDELVRGQRGSGSSSPTPTLDPTPTDATSPPESPSPDSTATPDGPTPEESTTQATP